MGQGQSFFTQGGKKGSQGNALNQTAGPIGTTGQLKLGQASYGRPGTAPHRRPQSPAQKSKFVYKSQVVLILLIISIQRMDRKEVVALETNQREVGSDLPLQVIQGMFPGPMEESLQPAMLRRFILFLAKLDQTDSEEQVLLSILEEPQEFPL